MSVFTNLSEAKYSYEAHAQFHTEDNKEGACINVRRDLVDITEAETFFDSMFRKMEFGACNRSPDPVVANL
jgi:hypothetical protein